MSSNDRFRSRPVRDNCARTPWNDSEALAIARRSPRPYPTSSTERTMIVLPGLDPKRLDPVAGRARPASDSLVERRQAATPMHGEPEQIGIRELARGDRSRHRSVEEADAVGPDRVSGVRREVSQDLASDRDLECVADGGIRRDPHEAELGQRTSRKPCHPAEPSPNDTMGLVA